MGFAWSRLPAKISVKGNFGLALTALACSDEHHTVGCLRTIDGCRGCVLEHIDALDVGGIERRDVSAYTVNQIER